MEQGMKESDFEGLATYEGPESCAEARKGEVKRWQGAHRPGY
jgi:hypothetical protein